MTDGPTTQQQPPVTQATQQAQADKLDESKPVVIHGAGPGQNFSIDGPGLGSGGSLTIAGLGITPTRWEDRTIRGVLPENVQPGEIVLTTQNGVRKGRYPYASAPAKK